MQTIYDISQFHPFQTKTTISSFLNLFIEWQWLAFWWDLTGKDPQTHALHAISTII